MYSILFVHHGEGIGGAPKSLLYTIENLDKSKFKTKVLFVKNNPEIKKMYLERGVDAIELNRHTHLLGHHIKGYIRWIRIYKLIFVLKDWYFSSKNYIPKLLEDIDPDILHLNSDALTNWAYGARKHRCKVICHVRDPLRKNSFLDLRYHLIRQVLKKYTDKIIAISNDNAKRLNLIEKTSIVYNFVNLDEYNYRLNVEPFPKRVLYMGGSTYIKGFNQIVKALEYLDEGIEVWFAGHYSTKKMLINNLRRRNMIISRCMKILKNSNNATIIGVHTNITEIIAQCSVIVSPFNVVHFSRPLIEGFAMKKPGIATNIPGMDEIIEHGYNGYLYKKNKFKDLATYINKLFSKTNEELINNMSRNALLTAKNKFSSNNIKQIESIYYKLMNSKY